MPNGEGELGAGAAKSNWLEDTLRPLNFVATMRERRKSAILRRILMLYRRSKRKCRKRLNRALWTVHRIAQRRNPRFRAHRAAPRSGSFADGRTNAA